ncbi:MAG: hypothetical protein QM718_01285 [Steroidobacteraceae bacterium]
MNKLIVAGLVAGGALAAPAFADVSYLKCEVQVTFRKPYVKDTVWEHKENKYTKYYKLDSTARMVYSYDNRKDSYKPVCSAANKACAVQWNAGGISIDGTKAADDPSPPSIDFRRSVQLSADNKRVSYVIADFGDPAQKGRMGVSWTYDGDCATTEQPARNPRYANGPGAGASRPPENPNYDKAAAPAKAVSKEEADKALAGYYGNTMTGFSGGGHWFHMWFLEGAQAYTGDDEDITSEGKARSWYVGKDSTGYRLCGEPIPAEGRSGCYPLPVRKVGESWVQHDMDGDAYFSLLPGRQ